jgi:hypothetical protein
VADFFAWLQSTSIARAVAETQMLIAALSAIHLIGLALVVGSSLVSALALTGLAFPGWSSTEMAATGRAVLIGLCISVLTGVLMFASRAEAASQNSFFQLKMLLLIAAAVCQLAIARVVRRTPSSRALRPAGVLGLTLWVGVALAGCAFILLE